MWHIVSLDCCKNVKFRKHLVFSKGIQVQCLGQEYCMQKIFSIIDFVFEFCLRNRLENALTKLDSRTHLSTTVTSRFCALLYFYGVMAAET